MFFRQVCQFINYSFDINIFFLKFLCWRNLLSLNLYFLIKDERKLWFQLLN